MGCEVNSRLHERCADTFALPVISYRHPNSSCVATARVVRKGLQAQLTDNLVLHTRHQAEYTFRRLCQTLAPSLGGGKRQLERPPDGLRPREHLSHSLVVTRFSAADRDIHVCDQTDIDKSADGLLPPVQASSFSPPLTGGAGHAETEVCYVEIEK